MLDRDLLIDLVTELRDAVPPEALASALINTLRMGNLEGIPGGTPSAATAIAGAVSEAVDNVAGQGLLRDMSPR